MAVSPYRVTPARIGNSSGLRLIPNLTDDNLSGLAWHIRGITALAIAFVGELGMVPVEGCRQPQAGGVADASRGDAVRTDSHGKRRLRAGLPSCQSVWQRFWPPFCPRTCSTSHSAGRSPRCRPLWDLLES